MYLVPGGLAERGSEGAQLLNPVRRHPIKSPPPSCQSLFRTSCHAAIFKFTHFFLGCAS